MENISLDKIIMAALGVLGTVLAYIFGTRKRRADLHSTEANAKKVEFETLNLEMGRFLELLARIETAHKQSLEDDTTIAQLRRDVEECRNGHKDWMECRDEVVEFLISAEATIAELGDRPGLLTQITTLRGRLISLSMGRPNDKHR